MINYCFGLVLFGLLVVGVVVLVFVCGDNLFIYCVQQEKGMNLFSCGMSMVQVEKKYGVLQCKFVFCGGDSVKYLVINCWDYVQFIVYFEKSYVIYVVFNMLVGNNINLLVMN